MSGTWFSNVNIIQSMISEEQKKTYYLTGIKTVWFRTHALFVCYHCAWSKSLIQSNNVYRYGNALMSSIIINPIMLLCACFICAIYVSLIKMCLCSVKKILMYFCSRHVRLNRRFKEFGIMKKEKPRVCPVLLPIHQFMFNYT